MKSNNLLQSLQVILIYFFFFFLPAFTFAQTPDSFEDDDTFEQAKYIVIDASAQPHNFHDSGDEDWIKFYGISGFTYEISAENPGTYCNVVIELYDSDHNEIMKENFGIAGEIEQMIWKCLQDAFYYVKYSNCDPDPKKSCDLGIYGENITYGIGIIGVIGPSSSMFTSVSLIDAGTGSQIQNSAIAMILYDSKVTALYNPTNNTYTMSHPQALSLCIIKIEAPGYQPYEGIVLLSGTSQEIRMIPIIPDAVPAPVVESPVFSEILPSFNTIIISCPTSDAVIHYTADNSEPSESSACYIEPIVLYETTTMKAKAFKSGWTPSEIVTKSYTITPPPASVVASPVFSPVGGNYTSAQSIAISCPTSGAAIRYTTDNSEPSESSTLYTGPVSVSATTTLKAKAFKFGWTSSEVITQVYTITLPPSVVASPVFSPGTGAYNSAQSIAISCPTSGAAIRYTIDNSDPTESSTLYSVPVSVSSTTTLKAKAFKTGWTSSGTVTQVYTITSATPPPSPSTVEPPVFSPGTGAYNSAQSIVISCPTSGAVIRYTSDNSNPTESSFLYTGPVSVSATTTLKAKAFKTGWTPSDTVTQIYTITPATPPPSPSTVEPPVFSPGSGTYTSAQSIAISCPTSGSVIRYTTDNSEPSESSTLYTRPVSVSSTTALRAKAFKTGWNPSMTTVATYTMSITDSIFFSPGSGEYHSEQDVVLSCAVPDATIRYTADGTEPVESSSRYTKPVHISETAILKAKAFKSGWTPSQTATSAYTMSISDTILFSPASGEYCSEQNVSLSCNTPGVTIRYTTDGKTEPTINSMAYTAPIAVSETTLIKAKAFRSGWNSGTVAEGNYKLRLPDCITFSPESGTHFSNQKVVLSCSIPGTKLYYTLDKSEPDKNSMSYTEAISISETTLIKAKAFRKGWSTSPVAIGSYEMAIPKDCIRFMPAPGTYTEAPTVEVSCECGIPDVVIRYIINDRGSEDALYSSPILLSESTTVKARAFKEGWTFGNISQGTYMLKVKEPVILPASNTSVTQQEVRIYSETPGVTIRYTTDGSEPTENSSVYDKPFSVSQTSVVKAKSFKSGWESSGVVSERYTIKAAKPVLPLESGTYTGLQKVVISCETPGAVIHYTTDGSIPSKTSPCYDSETLVSLSKTTTLKAKAFKENCEPSEDTEAVYRLKIPAPQISSDAGGFSCETAEIRMLCEIPDAEIVYTTDGKTPTESSSVYDEPFTAAGYVTVIAVAYKPGWEPSDAAVKRIAVKGDINGDCSVDISDVILGLQILTGADSIPIRSDYTYSEADLNGDGKVGSAEIVYLLIVISK
jgi:hypothetical protein